MHRTASPDTTDAGIEAELKALGKTAPRITSDDIKANIAAEHYFTAADGGRQVSEEMVNRFLGWKLPPTFGPDGGIGFDSRNRNHEDHSWPIGTNLFTATEARAMLEHVLQPQPEHESLRLLTICVLVLRNGFTVIGHSACASPENFDAEVGRKLAKAKAFDQVWHLMGYELRSRLAAEAASMPQPVTSGGRVLQPHEQRVVAEYEALCGNVGRLRVFLSDPPVPQTAAELERKRRQLQAMDTYAEVLAERIAAFGEPPTLSDEVNQQHGLT